MQIRVTRIVILMFTYLVLPLLQNGEQEQVPAVRLAYQTLDAYTVHTARSSVV